MRLDILTHATPLLSSATVIALSARFWLSHHHCTHNILQFRGSSLPSSTICTPQGLHHPIQVLILLMTPTRDQATTTTTTTATAAAATTSADMSATRQSNDEKLVLASMKCSYEELQAAIRDINFASRGRRGDHDSPITTKNLPPELSTYVASFLTVKRCDNSKVKAVSASSMDNLYKLGGCLKDDTNSWWLSGSGSMPEGRGEEYVQFQLCPNNTLCRLEAVSMSIPPLPAGPLSVREFRLDVMVVDSNNNKKQQGTTTTTTWRKLPQIFQVANQDGMQRFSIIGNGVDAQSIRVVCLSNQLSESFPDGLDYLPEDMQRVGFYAVKFE